MLLSTANNANSFDRKLLDKIIQRGEDLKSEWESTAEVRDEYAARVRTLDKKLLSFQKQADENCEQMVQEFTQEQVPMKWRDRCFQKKEIKIMDNIFFTSYNPTVGQTDNTPCIAGGTGFNLCEMAKDGKRPIAFSQDLISWSLYGNNAKLKAGDVVILKSTNYPDDHRCNGKFIVSDALNARYKKRGDIFFMDSKDNISCNADVYIKKIYN